MQAQEYLQFGTERYPLEAATMNGIYEAQGEMTWYIEIYPPNEDNYLMLNALMLDGVLSPEQFNETQYHSDPETDDLFEHTVCIDCEERYLDSLNLRFGTWDQANQSIVLEGQGMIMEEEGLPAIPYSFQATLSFKALHLFETSQETTQSFVDQHLTHHKDHLRIQFEDVESGLHATISGSF